MTSPKDYSASNMIQKYHITLIIEEFIEKLNDMCGKCMDIGCGPGDITKDFLLPALHPQAQIIGTDISEKMIKYANETCSDMNRLQFEILDIETKNLPTRYISEFDHVFSFHTLMWCNDIRQAFKNIYQILRPNGTLLFYIIESHDVFEVLRILARDIRFAQYIPDTMKNIGVFHKAKNARKELKELLENVGFTVHHCSLREASYNDKKSKPINNQELLKTILSILPFLEDMPYDLKEEYKNMFIDEYMRRKIHYKSIHNEELILNLYKGLIVYAQKIV
ncbi:juvenile hormone acid O-methyltransferase-like [Monomorium pharaonis]|uniref:juvenile hormone acid O-methyltransferase-like n=1 Tax=Monomorium pharaonis TaxID=307658 RepID=UPI00063F12A4|nr:juvenile hormone acid O-methyltransferase-like [Monomorium pharaonis]